MNTRRRITIGASVFLGLFSLFVVSAYGSESKETRAGFAYDDYAEVLKVHVNNRGRVNYRALKASPEKLRAYLRRIAAVKESDYAKWSENEKIAFWLNAYNAITLKAIIDNYPIKPGGFIVSRRFPRNSIRQISGVWDELKFNVMGRRMTLSDIEHEMLRKKFNEPRVHMALVCAAVSCPKLRNEPYEASKLDEQLKDQVRDFLASPKRFRVDAEKAIVYLSPILKWFKGDFVSRYGRGGKMGKHDVEESAVLNFIRQNVSGRDASYLASGKYKIKYLDYDWSLNEQ